MVAGLVSNILLPIPNTTERHEISPTHRWESHRRRHRPAVETCTNLRPRPSQQAHYRQEQHCDGMQVSHYALSSAGCFKMQTENPESMWVAHNMSHSAQYWIRR